MITVGKDTMILLREQDTEIGAQLDKEDEVHHHTANNKIEQDPRGSLREVILWYSKLGTDLLRGKIDH